MKNKSLLLSLLASGLMSFTAMGAARADGVVLSPARLPSQARTSLLGEIAKAKKESPAAFKALTQVHGRLPALDAQKRGRFPLVTPLLRSLGRESLMPMLEQIAVDAPARGELSDAAWSAWRAGLIEAVGELRDGRSAPVLTAILDGDESDAMVVRAASAALGQLGDDASAQKLVSLSKSATGARLSAIVAGMGECHRAAIADALGGKLGAHPDDALAKTTVKALGSVGSSWAWKTPQVAVSGEEAPTRAAAAKALVAAFVAYEGEVRAAAATQILVVDDPSTPALISAAKQSASPTLAAQLDRLAERFAKNPAR